MITEVKIVWDYWYLHEHAHTFHEECGFCPYVTYGVYLNIDESTELNERVDEIRAKRGYLPCFDENGECDEIGWYEFHLNIAKWVGNTYRVWIYATPCYVVADDNWGEYEVKLAKEEQAAIAASIDRQCREELEMTLDEMLDEAEKFERR